MSRQDVQNLFDEYVFGFMFADIQREIDLARTGQGGGNLLAALGLLCYTEFMGGILRANQPSPPLKIFISGQTSKNFNAFFDTLGPCYQSFRQSGENVYNVFRCGMAHEYAVKRDCVIAMLDGGTASCGIGKESSGRYFFIVERYLNDFRAACQTLYNQLMAPGNNPSLPS
jgi:hypothetical protein